MSWVLFQIKKDTGFEPISFIFLCFFCVFCVFFVCFFVFFVCFLCVFCVFCVLEDSRELNRNSHLALAQFIAVPTRLLDSLPEEVAPPQSLQDRTGVFLRWGNVVRETREQLR